MAISRSQVLHALFVFYVLVMVVVFLVPVPRVPVLQGMSHPDKVFHLVTFAGFAFLYRLDRRSSVTHTLLVSLAFAGGIELVQWVLPYRSGDWGDFLAGAAGAGIGVVLTLLLPLRTARAKVRRRRSTLKTYGSPNPIQKTRRVEDPMLSNCSRRSRGLTSSRMLIRHIASKSPQLLRMIRKFRAGPASLVKRHLP